MMADFHDLITRMANELDEYQRLLLDDCTVTHRLSNEARAALGEADEPAVPKDREPASVTGQPSDGEVSELVAWLRVSAAGNDRIGATTAAAQLNRAAELLEQQAPVAVSERP